LVTGFLFSGTDWFIIPALIGFLLPIFIAGGLFFNAKPSRFSQRSVTPISQVNKSKVSKPNLTPPSLLSDPDIRPLEPLINKYERIYDIKVDDPYGKLPEWASIKKALDDVIFLNFQSISYFMENEVYINSIEKRNFFEHIVKEITTLASSCAWMIGKEWDEKNPNLKAILRNKQTVEISDVPFDAMQLLANAAYFPYFLFANIFTAYYDGAYGKNVRHQKNGHLTDTYQGMMKGMLACFLMGMKS
jgi:hypothetical protein